MTNLYKWTLIFGLGTILIAGAGGTTLAAAPGEQVKTTIDQVMEVLKDPYFQGTGKKAEEERKVTADCFT